MKQIFITLVIDDEETYENYKDCDSDIIMEDLRDRNLIKQCSMFDVVVEE